MANLVGVRPPHPGTDFNSVEGFEWASRLTGFLQDVAKLGDVQVFNGQNLFENQKIATTGILLGSGYQAQVRINKVSHNATDARSQGGNAALYIQHLIDGSLATINNVNCGIRCQIQSAQTSSASTNDEVCFYGGIYQSGVNVAGFGYHCDVYYAGSGGSSTMYGANIEMNRNNATGVMVGYHLRIVQSTFSTTGTDYGFLVSPSVGGNNPVTVGFSVGSSTFGDIPCSVAFDATHATTAIGYRLATLQSIQWDGNGGFIRTNWDGTSWVLQNNGVPKFAVNGSTGTMQWFGGTQNAASGAGGATALPATPLGYVNVTLNSVSVVIPYYAA